MIEIQTIVVPEEIKKERIDKFLSTQFPQLSRRVIQSIFQENKVFIDQKLAQKDTRISAKNKITLPLPTLTPSALEPCTLPLNVIYEDEHVLLINKSQGMVVYPGNGKEKTSIVQCALHHTRGHLSLLSGAHRPGIVHRLDKDTSGLLLLAKSNQAYLSLIQQFEHRKIEKHYYALVEGHPPLESGISRQAIARHRQKPNQMQMHPLGKPAETDWQVLKRFKHHTLLSCHLITGRTHQIRVHLSGMHFPIVGDLIYGSKTLNQQSGRFVPFCLQAYKLGFSHPISHKKMSFEISLLPYFQKIALETFF